MQKLKELFEDTFDVVLTDKKFLELKVNDIKEWDSIGNINLLLALEGFYKIKFSLREIESFDSIKSIIKVLEKKL